MTGAVRCARTDEAARLAVLDNVADTHPWTRTQYVAALEGYAGQSVLVHCAGAALTGCVVLAVAAGEGSICRIVVADAHRREGRGRVLLDAALARLRAAGAARCLLELRASNRAALALYESAGFSLDGVRKGYYMQATQTPGREDALLMSRSLED